MKEFIRLEVESLILKIVKEKPISNCKLVPKVISESRFVINQYRDVEKILDELESTGKLNTLRVDVDYPPVMGWVLYIHPDRKQTYKSPNNQEW